MAFGVIIIGDEVLSGRRIDKHLPKVIELLGARGLSLGWAEYIGDDPERITATLRRTFESGDVVFSPGGTRRPAGPPPPPVRGRRAWRAARTASGGREADSGAHPRHASGERGR